MINFIRLFFLVLFLFLLFSGKMMLWFGLIIAGLIIGLFFGRIYCGYICPMNTLMIPAEKLSKKMGIQTNSRPKWLKNGYFTWIALFFSIALMLIFKNFLHFNLPILPIWLVISVLVTLRFKPEVFHNLICPFSGLLKFFGKFAKLSRRVDENTCIGCRKCEKVCPSNAIKVCKENKKAIIDVAFCHQCTNCRDVCPKNSIQYTTKAS